MECSPLGATSDAGNGFGGRVTEQVVESVHAGPKTRWECIDFQKVNAISQFDAYPIPRVDELFKRLGTANYISTLELTKRYWQMPLTSASRNKIAFPTPFGLYQFITMLFGLHWAAVTFEQLMDQH